MENFVVCVGRLWLKRRLSKNVALSGLFLAWTFGEAKHFSRAEALNAVDELRKQWPEKNVFCALSDLPFMPWEREPAEDISEREDDERPEDL